MSTMALVGRPGTGKTTLACSACKAGYKVLLIDVDKKAEGMNNLVGYLDKGLLEIIRIKSPLIAEDLKERAKRPLTYPQKQPEGYLEIAGIINELYDDQHGADIVVLDSFSRVCAHLKRYMLFMSKKHHFEYSDWDSWYTILDEITESFLDLPFQHNIITYHNKLIRDEITGKVMLPVSVDGKYSNETGRYFSEMYQLDVDVDKAGKAVFTCRTKPDNQRDARSSFNLDTVVPSDLSLILPKKGGV